MKAGDTIFEHPMRSSQRCAMVEGYSAHANIVVKAEDGAGLRSLGGQVGGNWPYTRRLTAPCRQSGSTSVTRHP